MFLNFAIKRRLTKHLLKIMDIHVYSPGVGTDKPKGPSFRININLLSLWSFAVSFRIKWLSISFHHLNTDLCDQI